MSLHSLPVFVRLQGRAVVLVGMGEAADAKRRLLERAGAVVVGEDGTPFVSAPSASAAPSAPMPHPTPFVSSEVETQFERSRDPTTAEGLDFARQHPSTSLGTNGGKETSGGGMAQPQLAIVVDDEAAVARLKARGILVNAVDRPGLCDFTLPAIVDRDPVIVAIGTGGASAGLAAALRQRLETLLPTNLGPLATALHAARDAWRARYPDATGRRRAIAAALAPGAAYDPLGPRDLAGLPPEHGDASKVTLVTMTLTSPDPDDLTLRQARALANADRVTHGVTVPAAILDRARADADRVPCDTPPANLPGLTVDVRMA